jgi:protein TonB
MVSKIEKDECAEKKMMKYVYSSLNYPVEARKKRIEGRVTLRFAVMKDGKIEKVEVLRDIGGGCGEEAKRVIESMNSLPEKWIPGSQGGKNVNIWITFPVVFKLNG